MAPKKLRKNKNSVKAKVPKLSRFKKVAQTKSWKPRLILALLLLLGLGAYFAVKAVSQTASINAIGSNICKKLSHNQCAQNNEFCEWYPNKSNKTNKPIECSPADCRKGVKGCELKINARGKEVCKGKYTPPPKNPNYNDGRCDTRRGIAQQYKNHCVYQGRPKEPGFEADGKICIKGEFKSIECNPAGGAYCKIFPYPNGNSTYYECDKFKQIKKKVVCQDDQVCSEIKRGCIRKNQSEQGN